ncbi:MAG: patatin-like phospholipase family protein [Microthrixaceae bacterium]
MALVLGSGGARGYAHIGVVQVLRELGYDIVAVSGSSMGAVVGGMLATDRLDDFTDWAVGLGQFEVLRLMDVSLSSKGAIRGEKIFKVVGDLVGDVAIERGPPHRFHGGSGRPAHPPGGGSRRARFEMAIVPPRPYRVSCSRSCTTAGYSSTTACSIRCPSRR